MAKFDFNSSRYAKFFSSPTNQKFLQTYLDTEGIIYENLSWYKTQGTKSSTATTRQTDGTATFTVKSRKLIADPLMDMRAPLGDSNQMDEQGLSFYTASIPDFIAKGITETALEREDKLKRFEMFGNDADIVEAWTQKVQSQVNSADATMNFMTASLMSTGNIDYRGIAQGIQSPIHKANIPTENFCKAGNSVWSDTDNCEVLTQMATIEDKYRSARDYSGALVWQIPYDMYRNYILKNKQVIDYVTKYRTLNYIATAMDMSVTDKMFRDAFTDCEDVSPIEVVVERERNLTNSGDAMIHGWQQNVAVLRPAGFACEFKYTDNLDQQMFNKYGSKIVTRVFASMNGGLSTLMNTTLNNGLYQEWHTDLMLSAVPALIEFPDHVIVDTATAG